MITNDKRALIRGDFDARPFFDLRLAGRFSELDRSNVQLRDRLRFPSAFTRVQYLEQMRHADWQFTSGSIRHVVGNLLLDLRKLDIPVFAVVVFGGCNVVLQHSVFREFLSPDEIAFLRFCLEKTLKRLDADCRIFPSLGGLLLRFPGGPIDCPPYSPVRLTARGLARHS